MIWRTIGRVLWVAIAFCVAAVTALIVLMVLGAAWLGDELRAAAPGDPAHDVFASVFGFVLFTVAVAPALTGLPALLAVIVGEVLRLRSWIYYVLAGGAALAVIPVLTRPENTDLPVLPGAEYTALFACAGFAGGFIYWLLAGQQA